MYPCYRASGIYRYRTEKDGMQDADGESHGFTTGDDFHENSPPECESKKQLRKRN
ncbi:hypothetical protein HMPREF9533_00575 [Escherichia coli MS 60-1]|nr:hypothetical protein HMPREF9533_00575 [Escherichia coli MS 60-1]